MKKKGKKLVFVFQAILVLVFVTLVLWHIEVDESPRMIEYGEIVRKDPECYAKGFGLSVSLCQMDFTNVDETKVGDYELLLRHGWKEYRIPIHIQDTKAPVIIKKDAYPCFEVGKKFSPKELVDTVLDKDPDISYVIIDGEKEYKELLYHESGQWSVCLKVSDRTGNSSIADITFKTDTAPEFYGTKDFYVARMCQEVSYSVGVEAVDAKDGNITDDIKINESEIDIEKNGCYDLVYEVTDSDGLKKRQKVHVYIMDKENLEEKIGNREINWKEDHIYGAENRYDAGSSVTDNLKEQLDYLLPTEVHLYFVYPNNPDIIDSSGSGFILYMDEANIYICTNYHVIKEEGTGYCYFYNGVDAPIETIGYNEPFDVAVLKVKRKDIPEDTYKNLMTVHLNKEEFEIAKQGGKPIFVQKLNKQGFEYYHTGNTISFGKIPFRLLPETKTLATNLDTYYGSSGSAVMDYEGNLIGMVSGFEDYDSGRIFHEIGMMDVKEKFEEITGINLYSE